MKRFVSILAVLTVCTMVVNADDYWDDDQGQSEIKEITLAGTLEKTEIPANGSEPASVSYSLKIADGAVVALPEPENEDDTAFIEAFVGSSVRLTGMGTETNEEGKANIVLMSILRIRAVDEESDEEEAEYDDE